MTTTTDFDKFIEDVFRKKDYKVESEYEKVVQFANKIKSEGFRKKIDLHARGLMGE